MARLVIVSNRVALPHSRQQSAGWLSVALREALLTRGGLWFGWSGKVAPSSPSQPTVVRAGRVTYATVDLDPGDYRDYYLNFANGMLWPLFHYRPGLFAFERGALAGYRRVNDRLAAYLAPLLEPEDLIWIHDYHFFPLAASLRRLGVRNRMGFFLHIPFPVPELLLALPGHRRLVTDLLHFDLIGLQTADDVRALQRYVVEELRGGVHRNGTIMACGRRARVAAFPVGIETADVARMAAAAVLSPATVRLRESLVGRSLVIGVDRLDYSKGLTLRFEAFQELLTGWPEHREQVTLLQIAPISRGDVKTYRDLRRELDSLVGRINGKFAKPDWTPVRYLNSPYPRSVLTGFLRLGRVGFVTPTRDGMNLVAKEYAAAQDPSDPGVLVLSRFAGAARELDWALIVNPYDVDEMAESLHVALTMAREERIARWSQMFQVVARNTIGDWRDRYLAALSCAVRN